MGIFRCLVIDYLTNWLIYWLIFSQIFFVNLFSIIIGNFSSKAGLALLTKAQREWIDLQKLIKRQRPSNRPKKRPKSSIRAWCYDRAVHKHGWWSRTMTFLFIVHIAALMWVILICLYQRYLRFTITNFRSQTLSTQSAVDQLRGNNLIRIFMSIC